MRPMVASVSLVVLLCAVVCPCSIHAESRTVQVSARNPRWQDTGIYVRGGTRIRFSATGTVVHWKGQDGREKATCGPEGIPGETREDVYLTPGLIRMGLVGKIENRIFNIGRGCDYVPEASGNILLGINDQNNLGGCADNEGSWTVTITVDSPKSARTRTVRVSARDPRWQDTGVYVKGGTRIQLLATGTVVHWRSQDRREKATCGPEGIPGETREDVYLAPGLIRMGLVGKIENRIFNIGRGCNYVPEASGNILLGINDQNKLGGCADNEGSWTVTIQY